MKHLDRRISPWFLPLLFVVVLLCINWMGDSSPGMCIPIRSPAFFAKQHSSVF